MVHIVIHLPYIILSGRKANLLGSKNVGEVNPNVHHLILVSTLHFCYYLYIYVSEISVDSSREWARCARQ